jgi:hypothetical protein
MHKWLTYNNDIINNTVIFTPVSFWYLNSNLIYDISAGLFFVSSSGHTTTLALEEEDG